MDGVAQVAHSERAHAVLSASGCYRWWECPGSTSLSEGIPSYSSVFAREGTAAHELIETCLRDGSDAAHHLGEMFNGFEVTEDMANATQVMLDTCRQYMGPGWIFRLEYKFTLDPLQPPVAMFGTSDFTAYNAEKKLLVVCDYKHGKGIGVKVQNNKQLWYYALGMLLSWGVDHDIQHVELVIVQPRFPGHPPVQRDTVLPLDLMFWSVELIERAKLAMSPDAPVRPGEWCRFCPAAPCEAQLKAAQQAAADEFSDDAEGALVTQGHLGNLEDLLALMGPPGTSQGDVEILPPQPTSLEFRLRDVKVLTPDQVGELLHRIGPVEDFVKALKGVAMNLLNQGVAVGDWKLVAKRPTRKFTDETAVVPKLTLDGGLTEDQIWTRRLLSPAQAEKALALRLRAQHKITAKEATARAKALISEHVVSVSSGPTLAPGTDPRPALSGVGEFEALSDDTQE